MKHIARTLAFAGVAMRGDQVQNAGGAGEAVGAEIIDFFVARRRVALARLKIAADQLAAIQQRPQTPKPKGAG